MFGHFLFGFEISLLLAPNKTNPSLVPPQSRFYVHHQLLLIWCWRKQQVQKTTVISNLIDLRPPPLYTRQSRWWCTKSPTKPWFNHIGETDWKVVWCTRSSKVAVRSSTLPVVILRAHLHFKWKCICRWAVNIHSSCYIQPPNRTYFEHYVSNLCFRAR